MNEKKFKFICIFILIFLFGFQLDAHSTTIVSVVVSEGIVLAGDSRATATIIKYDPTEGNETTTNAKTNQKKITLLGRVATDYAQKVFKLNDKVGAMAYGQALILNKSIQSLVEEFKVLNSEINTMTIDEVAKKLNDYFKKIYEEHLSKYPDNKIDSLGFMIAGYDSSGEGKLFELNIPSGEIKKVRSTKDGFGANWHGQTDVIMRLIIGCSPELAAIIEKNNKAHIAASDQQIDPRQSEYILGFEYMTIRDAIDLATFLIKTTIETQRFSYGTKRQMGIIPGVGGDIDVAIITPEGFRWVKKKQLNY
ncbi:MAG: hypothetical protein AB1629_06730 [Candidatus Omnitrophota bacterium]